MSSAVLVPVLALAAVVDWAVALTLVRYAIVPPRIAALTERAVLAVVIACVLSISSFLAYAASFQIVDAEVVRWAGRVLYLMLAATPPIWLVMYRLGRFGQ